MNAARNGTGFDTEAREAEILGKPGRIAPLDSSELTDEARAVMANAFRAMGMAEDTPISASVRIFLRTPELFRLQMETGTALAARGTLPRRETELAILRTGWLCGAPYEWGEHVEIGKRFGLTTEEVERVTVGSSAPGWSAHDRAILKGVEELIADFYISDETWDVLAASWDDAQLLEFPVLVGLYVMTGMQQNAIRVRLRPENPGLRNR